MRSIFSLFRKKFQDEIGEWDYYFFQNLPESEYPKYLKKLYKYKTGKNLNLKHPKTFTEKIQWIKLYGVTPLMRDCTDKVKVRDFVKEKIGDEYLKPVLQIIPNDGEPFDVTAYFEQIDFDKLPNAFVIKCNHGCKWQYRIKKKNEYLSNKRLIDITKNRITGWLIQEFWSFEGFEMNYRGIPPKILIEPFMKENSIIEIYCFNGIPQIYVYIKLEDGTKISIYNSDYTYSDFILKQEDKPYMAQIPVDEILKEAVLLSGKLSNGFKFVRVDWIIYQKNLYFEEMTFTPYSGFNDFGKKWEKKLGEWIEI